MYMYFKLNKMIAIQWEQKQCSGEKKFTYKNNINISDNRNKKQTI